VANALEPVLISNFARENERESASFSVVSKHFTEDDTEAMRKDYSSDPSAPNGTT
jgi:hypothetical protein